MEAEFREKMQEKLDEYIIDTQEYVKTVKDFYSGKKQEWISERKKELSHLREIKAKVKDMDQDDSRRKDLEKELGEVLKDTLEGLEKLQHFLDAVEKLAVTSLYIFMPHDVGSISVISEITTASIVSSLLLHFKRDAGAFFLPILNNMDTLEFQLNQYILITQQICKMMENGSRNVSDAITRQRSVTERTHDQISLKKENVEKQSEHLRQLINIRKDEKFRMCYLFNKQTQNFIKLFSESHDRMSTFLADLKEAADQLDRMKIGSDISSVVGSSVGIAGGVLSIAGVVLAPFTAGTSLALTIAGAGLGATSGVNGLVTGITETAVNNHHGNKARKLFTSFMEDVQKILDCIEVAADTIPDIHGVITKFSVDENVSFRDLVGRIAEIVQAVSTVKVSRSEEVIENVVNAGLQEVNAGLQEVNAGLQEVNAGLQEATSEVSGIGQVARGTSQVMSNTARVVSGGISTLFIGFDVYCIYNSSISLSKGSKNEAAQVIRDRSVLWKSEVEAWEKINDHLCNGISEFQKNLEILKKPFYI